jgi:hypothetical protein
MILRDVVRPAVLGVALAAAFMVGVVVERSGNNPVPGAVPVIGDKPRYGLIVQDGERDCDLYKRYPSGNAYKKDDGCPVVMGEGFRAGFHTVRDGWTVKDNVVTLVVVNDNPGPIEGFYASFYLNRFDGSMVALVNCETEPLAVGQSRAISCKTSLKEDIEPVDNVWIG